MQEERFVLCTRQNASMGGLTRSVCGDWPAPVVCWGWIEFGFEEMAESKEKLCSEEVGCLSSELSEVCHCCKPEIMLL